MTSDRLFVYGTLMRGFDHPMARLLAGHADFLGEATCRGRLVLVKHYPGLLLSDVASDIVHGELFHLRVPDELLAELDMYEACGEGFPQGSHPLHGRLLLRHERTEPSLPFTSPGALRRAPVRLVIAPLRSPICIA